jgi:iron complex outermembrane receptor protein
MLQIHAPGRFAACLLAALILTPATAFAQDDGEHGHDKAHNNDIVITGHLPVDFSLLASSTTLEDDQLLIQARGQLGEILASLPGVSSTSFTPGASRPVLRGLDGDRVRVLVDGIGSIDASSVSADHAVVFDPLTVDHIDVVHGPGVLLFGGQAIGGAVNGLDKRIPRSVPESVSATFIGGYGSAASERAAGGAVDIPLGDRFVAHFDANWRKSDDLRVGGFVHSPALREELLEEAAKHFADSEFDEAEEFEELANLSGRVPNTGSRSYTLGAGLAFIDAGGNLGISVQRQDMRYGVPLRPGGGHGHGGGGADEHGEAVAIDLAQNRIDWRGALEIGGFIDSVQFRGAYGDYKHVELEGDEIGTTFAGMGVESRLDLVQGERGGWRGRSGVQYLSRKLTIAGAEAFFPNNEIIRLGIFTLQSFRAGKVEIEGAGRFERSTVRSGPAAYERTFNLWSGAAGLSWRPAADWKLGVNYIRGARAPAPEELLTDGLHVATQAFEVGDPDIGAETSDGFEAYVRYDGGRYRLALTGYYNNFDGFITALPIGAEQDGFPVFQYTQLPARFQGFEAEAWAKVMRWAGGHLALVATADYTHAQLKGVGPAPRIPPLRLRGGLEIEHRNLRFNAEVERNDAQDRVAGFENPVDGFTMVNLSAVWHPMGDDRPVTLALAANNLFNVNVLRAASFTREFVPLAGRDVRLTLKFTY